MLRLRTASVVYNVAKALCNRFSTVPTNSADSFAQRYCLNLVKQYDYENFLCTLLLDGEKRRYAFGVRAFNVEIARIGSSITEDTIGRMRLQFWKDSIDKCFDKNKSYVLDQPVLKELKYIIDEHNLTKTYFKRLVTARDRPLKMAFNTIKEMEDYSEMSVSSLYYILLEIWNVKTVNVDHAISHLGKAQGIINLVRAIPHQNRVAGGNIPIETLIKHGMSQERLLRNKNDDKGVEECIFEIASVAHQHLEKSRSLTQQVPEHVRPLFLPAVAVERYLDRLRKARFRLYDEKLQQRDNLLPFAYYWTKLRRKY